MTNHLSFGCFFQHKLPKFPNFQISELPPFCILLSLLCCQSQLVMFKIQGAAKHESVATPENGTQMISQDRLALGKTKTKAAIKILLPAKATKKAPQVAQRKPKQRRSTEKKLKMSEYLHNDHLKALSLPKLIYTMRLATAQLHLHFSWMYRVLQAMETFRVLNANYLNLILEGARLREANAPLPDWMPP